MVAGQWEKTYLASQVAVEFFTDYILPRENKPELCPESGRWGLMKKLW